MMKMKVETKRKLTSIADVVIESHGLDSLYLTDWQVKLIAVEKGVDISYSTLKRYRNYLDKVVKNKITEMEFSPKIVEPASIEKLRNAFGVKEAHTETKLNDEVVEILLKYKSGKEVKFVPEVITQVQQTQPLWLGMFDYNNGKTVIRKGKYSGCNVFDTKSIKEHFTGLLDFYKYINWCYDQGLKAKNGQSASFVVTTDTPKDMETLRLILDKLEAKMNM